MFALILKNEVVQIKDIEVPVSASLQWIDINNINPTPQVGWAYDGSVFTSPPEPSAPPTNDEVYDEVIQSQKVLKAFVLCINDGTIIPGANVSGAELKIAIKSKM